MTNYIKIFNDVFTKEKPMLHQKYFLTEVQIVELCELGGAPCSPGALHPTSWKSGVPLE